METGNSSNCQSPVSQSDPEQTVAGKDQIARSNISNGAELSKSSKTSALVPDPSATDSDQLI